MVQASTTYRGRVVNPLSYNDVEDIPSGALVVDDGKIIEYGKFKDIRSKGSIVDFGDMVIIPGLIDTHAHLPQYDMVAMDGCELLEWLDNYIFPAEKRFESVEVARGAAARFFEDLKANGTTTSCVYSTVHKDSTDEAFKEAYRSGLRVFMGKSMMDQNSPPFLQEKTRDSIRSSQELCEKWHGKDGGRLNYVFSPRYAATCSMNLMKQVSKLAGRYDALIQTHLSENPHEIRLVKSLFPNYRTYTHIYEAANLLTPRTIMAHCIHLENDEMRLLRKYSVKIAHCPSSNFFLKSGLFNINKMVDAGLDIGLGSDTGGGPSLSMFKEMCNACNMSKANYMVSRRNLKPIDSTFAFYLATMGGAKVLGLGRNVGNFSIGKQADFVVLDAAKVDPLRDNRERSAREILSQITYRGNELTIFATFVRGVKIYERNKSHS